MSYVHFTTTITAICTPPGNGGVAMIRISGSEAIALSAKVFSKSLDDIESHRLVYGSFLNLKKETVDTGLLVIMRAPHSYTGEDVVELFCHGGHLVTKKVLQCLLDAGACAAGPGEFTQRAFLNKKMDLAQAEAVQALIGAKNEVALKLANQQLQGTLSQKIAHLQKALTHQAAILEAWVDFPEEGIEFCTLQEIQQQLNQIHQEMQDMLDSYKDGQVLKEGFSLCLLGQPNVGKSSLLNLLLKKNRAIVTPIAGTTRDIIEESLMIGGMQYHVTDTAGVRQTHEIIEQEGIQRAIEAAKKADLILWVMDASTPLNSDDQKLLKEIQNQKILYVLNKIDLGSSKEQSVQPYVKISAKESLGLSMLLEKIQEMTLKNIHHKDQVYLTELRHKEALGQAQKYLSTVITGLNQNVSPEWLTYDLKSSLKSLGQIIGFDVTESILTDIFQNFCIGK